MDAFFKSTIYLFINKRLSFWNYGCFSYNVKRKNYGHHICYFWAALVCFHSWAKGEHANVATYHGEHV